MSTETEIPQTTPSKKCKVCQVLQPLTNYYYNPQTPDKRSGVCPSCIGLSADTRKGRERVMRERVTDVEKAVDEAFTIFKIGDPKRDFLIKQCLRIILTPGTNQQSQLRANEMLAEMHGLTKETPKSETDLIKAAFDRIKQQATE